MNPFYNVDVYKVGELALDWHLVIGKLESILYIKIWFECNYYVTLQNINTLVKYVRHSFIII